MFYTLSGPTPDVINLTFFVRLEMAKLKEVEELGLTFIITQESPVAVSNLFCKPIVNYVDELFCFVYSLGSPSHGDCNLALFLVFHL